MADLGQAYVQIVASAEGISGSIQDALGGVGNVGEEAGGIFNSGLAASLSKFVVPAAIGTSLLAIGKIGNDMYSEVEGGMMNVITATGATGDAAKALEDVYQNVASSVVGSFEDIGSAVGEVNTRFGVTGDDLQGLSEQYMKFAKVNGVDVVNSIDQTQKALTAFGLDAEAAPAMLDAMTRAGQNTGVSMETLQNGLVQNAAAFQELGMDIDSSIGFMSQLEMSGANSTTVMSGLRKAMKNAAADGVPLDEALAQLQDTIQNGDESMDGLTAAYELFGKSGDQVYAAVKNGSLDFNSLTESMEGTDGALDEVYQNTLTNSEKMDLAMQNIKLAGADLFAPIAESVSTVLTDTVIPIVQSASDKISEFMTNVGAWYTENVAPVVEDVSAVVLPVVQDIISKVEDGIGVIGGVIQEVMPEIQAIIQKVWPVVSNIISTAVGVIKTVAPPVFNFVMGVIRTTMNTVQGIIQTVWPVASRIISTAVSTIKNVIGSISSIIGRVRTAFNSIKTAMTNPIQSAKDKIDGIVKKIKGFFPLSVGKIFSNIKLPHFKISGGTAPWGIGGQGTKPSISIDWYAKGGVFDAPKLIGVGEAGREAVIPLEGQYMRPFAKAIAEEMSGFGSTSNVTFNVTVNGADNPEEFADRMVRQLKLKVRTA